MTLLITMLVFVSVGAVVLTAYHAATAESPLERRLRAMLPGVGAERAQPLRPSLWQRFLAAVGRHSLGRDGGSLGQSLSAAGFRGPNAVAVFLGARTLFSFGPALLVLIPRVSTGRPLPQSLWLAAMMWAVGHVGSNLWLRRRSRMRTQQL